MRLEFLAHGIALALKRFAMAGVQAADGREFCVDCGNEGIVAVEIAGLAGAIGFIAQIVGNGGRTTLCVDAFD